VVTLTKIVRIDTECAVASSSNLGALAVATSFTEAITRTSMSKASAKKTKKTKMPVSRAGGEIA
jgi:hypothetical protein